MKLLTSKKSIYAFLIIGLTILAFIAFRLHFQKNFPLSQPQFHPTTVSEIKTFVASYPIPSKDTGVKKVTQKLDGYSVTSTIVGNVDSPVSFNVGGTDISFTSIGNPYLGVMNNSQGINDKSGKITYPNIYNGIDLIYTPSKDKILEEYQVFAKRKINYLVQKIDLTGLTYEKKADGSIIFTNTSTGKFAFAIPKPVMYEKYNTKNKSFGLHYEIFTQNGNTYLAKVIDEQGAKWLETQAYYPVMIDATILLSMYSYTSYPTVNNTWEIDMQTVGTGDLTIKPSTGTSWSLTSGTTADLITPALTCDGINIQYQTSNNEIVFPSFSCDGNIVFTTKVNDPTKQASIDVSYSGFTSTIQSVVDTGKPLIVSSFVNPSVVKVGDNLTINAQVSSTVGVASVSANIAGIDTLPLLLVSGDNKDGTYQVVWKVHGTTTKPYEVLITASDTAGGSTQTSIGFFDPYTCLGGGDHAGADWDPATDCASGLFAGNHTGIGILHVDSAQAATVQAFDQVSNYGIATMSASTATIAGTMTATGKGWAGGYNAYGSGPGGGGGAGGSGSYPGGGGYGGIGANGASQPGGTYYGSLSAPGDLGSGGGGTNNGTGGAGGGAIKITTTGTLTVSGTISSNGQNAPVDRGGGGSGGSIYISAGSLAGSGAITANGGNSTTGAAGGGAGGRIAIYYTNANSYTGIPTVTHGIYAYSITAQDGTVFIKNASNNDLVIPSNNSNWFASDLPAWTFHNLTINGNITFKPTNTTLLTINSTGITTIASGVTVSAGGTYTTGTNGVGVFFNLTGDITIATTSAISANAAGYLGGYNAYGSGPGGGGGAADTSSPGGGGYGGVGGSAGYPGGPTYGSSTQPTDLGSGGGGTNGGTGGAGGGAIKFKTTGTLTIYGTVSSTGQNGVVDRGGGGSGGSIWLIADIFTGSGTISVVGGNSTSGAYGGGGGGRLKMDFVTANNFTGTILYGAGTGGSGSSSGTSADAPIINSAITGTTQVSGYSEFR